MKKALLILVFSGLLYFPKESMQACENAATKISKHIVEEEEIPVSMLLHVRY